MDHMMKLAMELSRSPAEAELEAKFSNMSTEELTKIAAGFLRPALGAVAKGVGKASAKIMGTGLGMRSAVGAGAGAIAGGAKAMMAPQNPQTGQSPSVLRGALGGAAVGGLAGAASKSIVGGVGGMNNRVGGMVRGATMAEANATGNIAAHRAAGAMRTEAHNAAQAGGLIRKSPGAPIPPAAQTPAPPVAPAAPAPAPKAPATPADKSGANTVHVHVNGKESSKPAVRSKGKEPKTKKVTAKEPLPGRRAGPVPAPVTPQVQQAAAEMPDSNYWTQRRVPLAASQRPSVVPQGPKPQGHIVQPNISRSPAWT